MKWVKCRVARAAVDVTGCVARPCCKEDLYHRRDLPQVSFLSRQARVCRDKHAFVATEHVFRRDKSMLAATKPLSRRNHVYKTGVCRDKRFVATRMLLSRQKTCKLFATNVLSCKNMSRQKTCFVTKTHFCRDKHKPFVATDDTCGSSHQ